MTRGKLRQLVLFLAVVVVVFGAGFGWGRKTAGWGTEKLNLGLMWQVKEKLEEGYLDKERLDDKKMVYGSIKGLVSSLGDAYTVFLDPEENKVSEENLAGEFGGVGISLGYRDKTLAVISPLVDTPADKAGLQAGDLILQIVDKEKGVDRDTTGISLSEAVQLIRGKIGTVVSLKIYRQNEQAPFEVDLKRERIVIPSLELEWIEREGKKVAWVKMYKFSQNLYHDWEKVVEQILDERQTAGMVLDLRGNPGGYLEESVKVASDLLEEGVVVKQDNANGRMNIYKVDQTKGRLVKLPLVVMVDGGSASAAEILAGALRERGRARLVGQRTFGKGTVQQPVGFRDGSGLHMTIARWLLPSGESIDHKGVDVDVEVEDNLETQEDEQLEKAVEVLIK